LRCTKFKFRKIIFFLSASLVKMFWMYFFLFAGKVCFLRNKTRDKINYGTSYMFVKLSRLTLNANQSSENRALTVHLKEVLWIRIRKDPNLFAGSGSE
jgi:hypothetical protein